MDNLEHDSRASSEGMYDGDEERLLKQEDDQKGFKRQSKKTQWLKRHAWLSLHIFMLSVYTLTFIFTWYNTFTVGGKDTAMVYCKYKLWRPYRGEEMRLNFVTIDSATLRSPCTREKNGARYLRVEEPLQRRPKP